MKNLNFLFIAFVFMLASCSSDDSDSSNDISGDLIGTWIGEDVDYSGSTVTQIEGQNIVSDFVGESYDVDYTLTFSEDPNELVSNGSYSVELTTTTLGQTQVDNVEDINVLGNGTWSRQGDQLTVISNGVPSVGTILEITSTRLVLEINEIEDLSQQGFTITTTVNAIITLNKM